MDMELRPDTVLRMPPGNLPLWHPATHMLLCRLLFPQEQTQTFCPARCADASLWTEGRCVGPPRGWQRAEGLLSTAPSRQVRTPPDAQILTPKSY